MTAGQKPPAAAWRGFSAPQDASGRISLYGPPPWHFEGFTASALLAFDPARVAPLIPPGLALSGAPVARLSVHDVVCDFGLGSAFAQKNPDQARFGEAILAFLVEHDGVAGQWCPYLWCTSDAELAVGREFYGWPQRLGAMSLTRRPFRGWRAGDVVTGIVSRGQRAIFEFAITLEREGDLQPTKRGLALFPSQAAANQHYTQTALPDPIAPGMVRRRLFRTPMHDVALRDTWSGTAEVHASAPELDVLKGSEALGGRWNVISWTKPYPEQLVQEEQAPM